jgi:hypothetical protein
MFVQKLMGCTAAAAVAAFISIGGAQAAIYPAVHYGNQGSQHTPDIHHVDCAVGFHIGPAGACVLGTDDPPPPAEHREIIERRSVDEGCQTKSVHREDSMGNSETKTKSNCD